MDIASNTIPHALQAQWIHSRGSNVSLHVFSMEVMIRKRRDLQYEGIGRNLNVSEFYILEAILYHSVRM